MCTYSEQFYFIFIFSFALFHLIEINEFDCSLTLWKLQLTLLTVDLCLKAYFIINNYISDLNRYMYFVEVENDNLVDISDKISAGFNIDNKYKYYCIAISININKI